jgi:hypothetical protein
MAMKPLWQRGLDWLWSTDRGDLHWTARKRAISVARGMRKMGEKPDPADMRRYVRRRWADDPLAARMMIETWRGVYRAKTSRGRSDWHDRALYVPDYIVQDRGLRPTTETRLRRVLLEAVDALVRAADEGDPRAYALRKRDIEAALASVDELLSLRPTRPRDPNMPSLGRLPTGTT